MNTLHINKKLFIAAGVLVLVLVGLPLITLMSQKPQEIRSKASGSTTLELTPQSSQSSPITANAGDIVSLDVFIDPGANLPSVIKLDLAYDESLLQPDTTPFVVNIDAFPSRLEGPVILNGHLLISVSIGSDGTKAIQSRTKVGTVKFKTLGGTTEPTLVSFGNKAQILSLAADDESNQNVLSTTTPAYISIVGYAVPTATPTLTVYTTPTPIPTVEPTTPVYATPTTEPTVSPLATILSLNVFIHGIGSSGDNVNPTSDLSNKNPAHPQRIIEVQVYDKLNNLIKTASGVINYSSSSGTFTGKVDIGTAIDEELYTVKVKEPTHLRRLVQGILKLKPQSENVIPDVTLIAGDINDDNLINIADYNILIGCYSDLLPAASCTDANKITSDLNDDDAVNQLDYNLFLREVTVQQGS